MSSTSKIRRQLSIFALSVAIIAATNIPFWILGQSQFLSRALFSLDSIFALSVIYWNPVIGTVLVACSWVLDFVVSLSQTFHFLSPLEFLRSSKFAEDISFFQYINAKNVTYVAPFIIVLAGLSRWGKTIIRPRHLLIAGALLILLDALNGSSVLSNRAVRIDGENIAGSALYAVTSAAANENTSTDLAISKADDGGAVELTQYMPSAMNAKTSLIYFIVESLGVHQSIAVREWLQSKLYTQRVAARYDLNSGTVRSHGGTTSGELRRLCGLTGSYRRLTAANGSQCLPKIAADLGWDVKGYHGFSRSMFDRESWWPMIGIDQSFFAEDLKANHTSRCGAAFPGICDADLVADAFDAAQSPKSFVYALTLETHLPLSPIDMPDELRNICKTEGVTEDVCTLLARLSITLDAVAKGLGNSKALLNVMVVGDHPPPFSSLTSRSQFLEERVPLWALTPKNGDSN